MMFDGTIDVLVVGAGPVGLFCANELKRHGLKCRIIEKKAEPSDKSKALGIHIRTLDVLEDCGLLDEVLKQGHPVEGVLIKSEGTVLVDATFADIKSNRHYLIDLPQNKTEAILNQHLQDQGIEVEWETELTHLSQSPEEITATLHKPNNKRELCNAKWLIACDGAHSTVRDQIGAEFKGSTYKQTWWLADLLVSWKVPDSRMAVYINELGPLACFPMGDKRYRLVMAAPEGSSGNPTLDDIAGVFKARSSDAAKLSNPIWLSEFSIHHKQVQEYRHDKVFLAGDAAHIHSPMGGQGLNTGLQDIYNLVWKLALVQNNRANPELLDSYQAERFPIGEDVLKKTDRMTRMILLKNPLLVKLRNAFIRFISSFSFIKNKVIADIAELSISYSNSPIVHQSGCLKGLKAGSFLPDFELTELVTQQTLSSYVLTQGIFHHVFIFCGLGTKKLAHSLNVANCLAQQFPNSLKVHLVLTQKTEVAHRKCQVLLDEKALVHRSLGLKKPALILVRPDKYLGFVQKSLNQADFLKEFYLLS